MIQLTTGRREKPVGASTAIANSHIVLDEDGRAWIAGANTRVLQVAADRYAHGWSPEEIHLQHPHLSMAQIHAALSYYYDHRTEMDAEIEREAQEAADLRMSSTPSRAEKSLRNRGLIP
jgi:uncharacterized protein (DUF433 family)